MPLSNLVPSRRLSGGSKAPCDTRSACSTWRLRAQVHDTYSSLQEVIKLIVRQRMLLARIIKRILRRVSNELAYSRTSRLEETDRVVEYLDVAGCLLDGPTFIDVVPEHVIVHVGFSSLSSTLRWLQLKRKRTDAQGRRDGESQRRGLHLEVLSILDPD